MYIPTHFAPKDEEEAWRIVDAYPFATLIAQTDDGPYVSHLPLLAIRTDGAPPRLIGHMSRRNPQWQMFERASKALAIFHGPHVYVTPNWYTQHDVPTWNYAVVHVHGTVHLRESHEEVSTILSQLTQRFETGPNAWRFDVPDDLREKGQLAAAIIGFDLVMERIEVKFKLGQNRSLDDRTGIRQGLANRQDEMSQGILSLMDRLGI